MNALPPHSSTSCLRFEASGKLGKVQEIEGVTRKGVMDEDREHKRDSWMLKAKWKRKKRQQRG